MSDKQKMIVLFLCLTWFCPDLCYSRSRKTQDMKPRAGSSLRVVRSLDDNGLTPEPRIRGGRDVVGREFPFLFAIEMKLQNSIRFCGGSLINDRWILTAAHCVHGTRTGTGMRILMGSNNVNEPKTERWGYYYKIHPKYEPNGFKADDDIAIIRMNKAIQFDDNIKPVTLPICDKHVYDGKQATIAGWGSLGKDMTSVHKVHLQKASLQVLSNVDCLSEDLYASGSNKSMSICMYKQLVSVCIGDSGGPVLDPRGEQIGVISMAGIDCASVSLATRVPFYLDWIEDEEAYGEKLYSHYAPFNKELQGSATLHKFSLMEYYTLLLRLLMSLIL